MAIDYTTDLGKVRLLTSDVDDTNPTLTDVQYEAFLAIEDGIRRAAAAALETIATSEVLVSKVIRSQDLQTDGAKVAEALLARAKGLREQADLADSSSADDGDGGLEVVDWRPEPTAVELAEYEMPTGWAL